MRIVVVGATGNIGTALLREIASRSSVTSVDAVSRRGPGRLPAPEGVVQIRHHELDLDCAADAPAAAALADLAQGADAVVHLAWTTGRNARDVTASNKAISRNVAAAAARAHQFVVGSCASVYAASFGEAPRSETWPATGIEGSSLSQDKVGLEQLSAEFARRHPGVVVTRIRPAVALQESIGAELVRRFVGPLMPRYGLGGSVPILLWPQGLGLQVVHSQDVAAAILAAVERRAPGSYNVAASQVLDADDVADALGAQRVVEISRSAARIGHEAAWRTHLLRARPDWLTTLSAAPVLDTSRSRDLLGVLPQWSAQETLAAAAKGVAIRREGWTPALSRSREPRPVRPTESH